MPAERLKMRRVREILRYRFEEGLGHKSIAVRVGAAPSTVRETLCWKRLFIKLPA
ncbi:hypothetical protein RTCCBAU85039_6828 [Rhizobium tibeticum]|uniref:Transposase n=1 Tax=Rhizobium tibeticum TaxID=501024 RepID=A0A1K0KEP1_9HYPH|nr:hypothetical protein RTCCBAU85039_6828 [Rhizobium tibeticum]